MEYLRNGASRATPPGTPDQLLNPALQKAVIQCVLPPSPANVLQQALPSRLVQYLSNTQALIEEGGGKRWSVAIKRLSPYPNK